MSAVIDDAIELDFLPPDVDRPALLKVFQNLYDNATALQAGDSEDFNVLSNRCQCH
jgi:hypothetical protein